MRRADICDTRSHACGRQCWERGCEAFALTLWKFETQGSDDGFLDAQDDDVFN